MDRQLEELRVLRREEVSRLTGLARATLYAKVADGTFARPVSLGVVPRDVVYSREAGVAPRMPPCGRR